MKIFMGNPPWREGDNLGVRAGSRWPHFQKAGSKKDIPGYLPFPFFLAYATAVLEETGHEVLLIDAIAEGFSNETFLERIEKFDPELAVLEVSTPSIYDDLDLARKIKEKTNCLMAFAGPHMEMYEPHFLDRYNFVDFVIMGEYDYIIRDLASELANSKELDKVLGIIYRNRDGQAIRNKRRPVIENLDELPYPAYHQLPMYNYNDAVCALPHPGIQMWTSRGCPYHCIFCAWPQIMYANHKYRVRDPKLLIDEMEYLVKKYKFKAVYFDDDTVNIGKKRMLTICEEIKKRNLGVPWAIMARADTMDREILEAMADSGLYAVKYGVESGTQALVDGIKKNLDLKKVEEIVRITKELGIKTHLTFTFGLPGETKETIQKTIDYALELDPTNLQFSILSPFPGSEYYRIAKEKGYLLTENWADFNGSRKAVVRTEHLTAQDLEEALCRAYETWHKHRLKRCFEDLHANLGARLNELNLDTVREILLVRSSFMDHTNAALKVINQTLPKSRITVLAQPMVEAELRKNKLIDEVFLYKTGWLDPQNADKELIASIRKRQFDLLVLLFHNESHLGYEDVLSLIKLFGAEHNLGFDTQGKVNIIDGGTKS